MSENVKYSKIYMAKIIVENDWGYHLENLWYGSDSKNLALMIIDVMKSWYEPNKDVFAPSIKEFHRILEDAVRDENPVPVMFRQLNGEMFHDNGLKLFVELTNNLDEMYAFVFNESFEIFCVNDEKPEDFNSVAQYIDYLEKNCKTDEPILAALRTKDENSIAAAIYMIDIKYQYTNRHYIPQEHRNKAD